MTSQIDAYQLSKHAMERMQQRGLCKTDLDVICRFGNCTSEGYVMTSQALEEYRSSLKRELQRLDRLDGVVVIAQDHTIVTVYRATKAKLRSLRQRR